MKKILFVVVCAGALSYLYATYNTTPTTTTASNGQKTMPMQSSNLMFANVNADLD